MIYAKGSAGPEVLEINKKLLGVDSDRFSDATFKAVLAFQRTNKLTQDGVVGPKTWAAIFPLVPPTKPTIRPPETREELLGVFGDPLTENYWKMVSAFATYPKELKHLGTGVWCHRYIKEPLEKAFESIAAAGLGNLLTSFDGCYCTRYIRGSNTMLSTHAWGISLDFNAKTNALGTQGDMDPRIIELFAKEGFYNGGKFKRKDFMHFEFSKSGL